MMHVVRSAHPRFQYMHAHIFVCHVKNFEQCIIAELTWVLSRLTRTLVFSLPVAPVLGVELDPETSHLFL